MDLNTRRLHPLVATAAVSVILLSLVGIAALTGWLPGSTSAPAIEAPVEEASVEAAASIPESPVPVSKPAARADAPPKPHKTAPRRVAAAEQQGEVAPVVTASEPAVAAPAAPVCGNCGVVEFIRTSDKQGAQGEGVLGAVVGGVAGGLLGNQVGSGTGKKLATAAGAVGGALAGRRIEQARRHAVYYEIGVRFEDGRLQTFSQDVAPSVTTGQRVRVTAGTVFPQ
ncbi:MAG: glycine zipper 2TM domain-containing protein [Candidatus Macondimonas sp.]|jgi:outer membrane lipoprotein SlyB